MDEIKTNRHIDVRYHVCREAYDIEEVKLEYYPSTEMMAYIIAKPLGYNTFHKIKGSMPMAGSELITSGQRM